MLTFPEAAGYLPRGAKVRLTGLPVRDEITRVDREQARLQLGEGAGTVILSFGGSRGAERLNKAMADVVKAFQGRPDVKIYHSTGTAGYDDFLRLLRSMGIDLPGQGNVTIAPYFYQIAAYLAAADLVVCRAGAATIAELTYLGKPAILIPYPYAASNHQEFNAMALAKKGAANVIKDKELSGERLLREVNALLAEPGRLRRMADQAARLANPDALEDIITSVRELVTPTRGRV
jgi:UDP-N-acetylglucosamine--N-acetylmuramyl-(pentapeptide) pyrophosphoryl-undecaprenol N-acetylglucosamine transferase